MECCKLQGSPPGMQPFRLLKDKKKLVLCARSLAIIGCARPKSCLLILRARAYRLIETTTSKNLIRSSELNSQKELIKSARAYATHVSRPRLLSLSPSASREVRERTRARLSVAWVALPSPREVLRRRGHRRGRAGVECLLGRDVPEALAALPEKPLWRGAFRDPPPPERGA